MSYLARFRRGKDKKPRKRRTKRLGAIAGNTVQQGIAGAGLLGTAGLLATPQNAVLQGRLARGGLAAGAGYGLYQGIKNSRKKKRRLPFSR